ncbi:hypothetical protein HK405_009491, partial [Cladochytrium tenue]
MTDIVGNVSEAGGLSDSVIRTAFSANQLWSLVPQDPKFPIVAFDHMTIGMEDNGPYINMGLAFENPTIMSVPIDSVSLGIAISDVVISSVAVKNITLEPSLNRPNITGTLDFLSSITASPELVQQAIQSTVAAILANGTDALTEVAIVGPIEIPGADWLATMTERLALRLQLSDVLNALNLTRITDSGISGLLKNSSLEIDVQSDRIVAPIVVTVPRVIPLPSLVPVPGLGASVSIGAAVGTGTLLGALVSDMYIKTDSDAIHVGVTATILPNNTQAAADDLAALLNPILGGQGSFWSGNSNSSLFVDKIAVFDPTTLKVNSSKSMPTASFTEYSWSTDALDGLSLSIGLPASLGVGELLDALTNNGTSFPVSLDSAALSQKSDNPGFAVDGAIAVVPDGTLASLPRLRVTVGYIALDISLPKSSTARSVADTLLFANITLPSGLALNTTNPNVSVALDVDLALAPASSALSSSLQTLLDALLVPGAAPTYLGLGSILLGPSSSNPIVTFSSIFIGLNTTDITSIVTNLLDTLEDEIPASFIEVDAVGIDVQSATAVNLDATALVRNPWNISATLGTIDLDMLVDSSKFVDVTVDGIELAAGTAPLSLVANATLPATATTALQTAVASLLSELFAGSNVTTSVSIAGLTLIPPGLSASSAAVIDQFSNVSITIPSSLLNSLSNSEATSAPDVDLSPLLPTEASISAMNLSLSSASIAIDSSNTIRIAPAMTMTNPTNISASVGYASVAVSLGGVADAVAVQVSGLSLTRGRAGFEASLALKLADGTTVSATNGTSTLADALADAVADIVAGRSLSVPVAIGSILFGASNASVCDVFQSVQLNATSITSRVSGSALGDAAAGLLPVHFPATLSEISNALGLNVAAASVTAAAGAAIDLDATAAITGLPYSLDVSLGATTAAVGVGSAPLLGASLPGGLAMSAGGGSRPNFTLAASVAFSNSAATQQAVADLVAGLFATPPSLDASVSLSGISLAGVGASS